MIPCCRFFCFLYSRYLQVNFDYNEEDFDQMLEKLVFMCYYYDPRQIGPAGLVAFEADSMTPAEFREQMKRTFNVKLTAAELGAMVVYFDTASKKVVNCTAFMNSLVQIRVKCEEFKVTLIMLISTQRSN